MIAAPQGSPRGREYLADAELTLSSVKLLAPHADKPEAPELVEEARGKSKREVERLVAARCPDESRPRGPSFRARAVDGEHYKLEMTVDAEFLELLDRAVDLDRHRNPEGDRVKILREGLERQIAAAEKRKYKCTTRPRAPKPEPTDAVPAEVRRGVHERDGGRGTWIGEDGRRCNATAFIEHDHVIPRARGGENTIENGRQLCRAHNQRAAELALGTSQVGPQAPERRVASQMRADALLALRQLGFKEPESAAATVGVSLRGARPTAYRTHPATARRISSPYASSRASPIPETRASSGIEPGRARAISASVRLL